MIRADRMPGLRGCSCPARGSVGGPGHYRRLALAAVLVCQLLAPRPDATAATVEEVRSLAGARNVEQLLLAVADADAAVAQLAAQSLDELNEPLGSLLYAAIWRGEPEARAALAARRDFRATAPLIQALQMPLPAYQRQAAMALGELGDKSAVPALIELIRRQEASLAAWTDRAAPYWALYKLGDARAFDVFLAGMGSLDPNVRAAAAWGTASHMDARAVPLMLAALDDSSAAVRAAAAHAFRNMPTPEATPVLIRLLSDPDPVVREKAAYALAEAGDESARLPLRETLGDDAAPVREAAVWAVGRYFDEASIATLFTLLGDPDAKVRTASAKVLEGLGQSVGTAFLAALNGDAAALSRLATDADPRVVPPLIELAAGDDAAIRRSALQVLAGLPDAEARAALLDEAAQWNPVKRTVAAWALITAPAVPALGKAQLLARVAARPSSLAYLCGFALLVVALRVGSRRWRWKR